MEAPLTKGKFIAYFNSDITGILPMQTHLPEVTSLSSSRRPFCCLPQQAPFRNQSWMVFHLWLLLPETFCAEGLLHRNAPLQFISCLEIHSSVAAVPRGCHPFFPGGWAPAGASPEAAWHCAMPCLVPSNQLWLETTEHCAACWPRPYADIFWERGSSTLSSRYLQGTHAQCSCGVGALRPSMKGWERWKLPPPCPAARAAYHEAWGQTSIMEWTKPLLWVQPWPLFAIASPCELWPTDCCHEAGPGLPFLGFVQISLVPDLGRDISWAWGRTQRMHIPCSKGE